MSRSTSGRGVFTGCSERGLRHRGPLRPSGMGEHIVVVYGKDPA
jgi:hypothetical protein